jgi:2-polyprenyl-3-methyl-5-hydroxy-6-metoxy-1,4-benzoquinol methylase
MSLQTEKINCLICNHPDFDIHYPDVPDRFSMKDKYNLVRCKACGFSYLSPRLVEIDMAQFYDLDEYQPHKLSEQSLFDRIYKIVRDKNSVNKRRLIERLKERSQLIDIGCGTGEFLMEMKQQGWRVGGMESAPEARMLAIEKDLNIYENSDEIEGKYDIITMWHVLEHVHRVEDLFENIKRILAPGGYLVLAVPNIESFDARYFKNTWVALDAPRHLYHFRPVDIYRLLKFQGFEIIKLSSLLYFDPWYNSILSAKVKSDLYNRSYLCYIPEAILVAKLSFLLGLINSKKSASPVYVAKQTS